MAGLRHRFNVISDTSGGSQMRISRSSYLAVECLVRLARQKEAGPCTAETLAQWINRSNAYTELILARLRLAGLVKSTRGPGGGYRLGRGADTISVSEVFVAMGEWCGVPVRLVHATSVEPQTVEEVNGAASLWRSLSSRIVCYLERIVVSDLIPQDTGRQHVGTDPGTAERGEAY